MGKYKYPKLIYALIIILLIYIIIINRFNKIDNKKCSNSLIYIDSSEKGGQFGRGVYANKNFKKDDIIEIGPLLIGTDENMFIGLYKNYVFKKNNKILLILGFTSICNHTYNNNSKVIINDDYYKLIAIKNIKKGEEILINYCEGKTKEECDIWFSSKNIQQIE